VQYGNGEHEVRSEEEEEWGGGGGEVAGEEHTHGGHGSGYKGVIQKTESVEGADAERGKVADNKKAGDGGEGR
jgi:hypothetical protein